MKTKVLGKLTSANVAFKAFKKLLNDVDSDASLYDRSLSDGVTYAMFELNSRKRLPALRMFNDLQIFSISHLQRYCAIIKTDYKKLRPFIDDELAEDDL